MNHSDEVRHKLQRLAWLLDNSVPVPGINFRIGLDALLGLIPGFGDAAGVVLSSYIVHQAWRLGVPRSVLLRMWLNIVIEGVVGAVPLLGDVFDAAWKANVRNVALLEAHMRHPQRTAKASRLLIVALTLAVIAIVVGALAVGWLVLRWIMQLAGA
ncbi:MAG TPA: DUF4112 domain-containing protein [Burkholderiales bacterium]|nr:DUF4112 domain-containing protein [Burkholderiales bacterium]